MASRDGHVAKTRAQRRQYVDSVVRGQDVSATVPTSWGDEDSATDAPMMRGGEQQSATIRPSRRRGRGPSWWDRNKPDIVRGIIGGVLGLLFLGLTALITTTLIGLNREVGQLQRAAEDTTRQLGELRNNATRSEDRLDAELRRLRERLDDLRDRLLGRKPPSKP